MVEHIGEALEKAVAIWCADKSSQNLEAAAVEAKGYVIGIVSTVKNPLSHLLSIDDLIQCGLLGFFRCQGI